MAVVGAVSTLTVMIAGWWSFERGAGSDQNRQVVALLTGVLLALAAPSVVGMWRRPADRLPRRQLLTGLAFVTGCFRAVGPEWAAVIGAAVWFATPTMIVVWLVDRRRVVRPPRLVSAAMVVPSIVAVGLVLSSGPHERGDAQPLRAISWVYYEPSIDRFVRQLNPLGFWSNGTVVVALTIAWSACLLAVAGWVVFDRDRTVASRFLVVAASLATIVLAAPRRIELVGAQSSILDPWFDALMAVPAIACACAGASAVWTELVRPRLSQSEHGALRLDARTSPGALRRDVVLTLGDPTVKIVYRSGDGWIDEHGRDVEIGADDQRGVTVIRRHGEDVAALEHDISLVGQPDLVQVAATSLAMSLESQRLAAIASAASEDARASAARLLEAAEAGRLDVEQRILTGPDRTLQGVERLLADRPLDVAGIHEGLRTALAEVRAIAHGSIPVSLEDQGLGGALDDLRGTADVRLDIVGVSGERWSGAIESTLYRVVADGVASATGRVEVEFITGSDQVTVRVSGAGAGVSTLTADRVEALGGKVASCATMPDEPRSFEVTIPVEGAMRL